MRTIIFLCFLLAGLSGYMVTHQLPASKVPHTCNWKGCDYKGLTELPALYNPIDSIHFAHPEMEYDKAESLCK